MHGTAPPGRCGCGMRQKCAPLRKGRDVLDVVDLHATPSTTRPWADSSLPEEARSWAVNYLIEHGWLAHEVVHLVLEHGRWRDMGREGAPAKVRAFVRDISIGAHRPVAPASAPVNVMRRRTTVRSLLEQLAETE